VTRYENLDGDSGVEAYDAGTDFIDVQFRTGMTYHYDHTAPGELHVRRMKQLAIDGRGLSSYISRHVRGRYARKWP
jgi:hypothetical protein